MADGTIGVKAGSLSGTSMRYHELALQRWLNRLFIVREGYPVPVVFATPMDAFSQFLKLWSAANNPFQYLLNAVDEQGTPLYQPYPAQVRYPLLSVYRKGFKYRSYQNFSIHRFRHINWPTVSPDVGRCGLGNVSTSRMPMAWDYRFQIDYFCLRPDTQAFFVERLMWEFYKTGGTPQTWIEVNYPIWGKQLVRVYIDGDIENSTPEEPEPDKTVEFRTTLTLVVEGFSIDLNVQVLPVLWDLIFGESSVDPATLESSFNPVVDVDVRFRDNNPTLNSRSDVPSDEHCQVELNTSGSLFTQHVYYGDPTLTQQTPQGQPPFYPPQPGYPGGIPSSAQFGVFTISTGTIPPPVFVTSSGTDFISQYGGFLSGEARLLVYQGTESTSSQFGFSVGSLTLTPWVDATSEVTVFSSGTLATTVVSGGSGTDAVSSLVGIYSGTLFNTTVLLNAGTEFVQSNNTIQSGDLVLVVVDGGTRTDSISSFYASTAGTLTLIMIDGGTRSESVASLTTFQSGSLG